MILVNLARKNARSLEVWDASVERVLSGECVVVPLVWNLKCEVVSGGDVVVVMVLMVVLMVLM